MRKLNKIRFNVIALPLAIHRVFSSCPIGTYALVVFSTMLEHRFIRLTIKEMVECVCLDQFTRSKEIVFFSEVDLRPANSCGI